MLKVTSEPKYIITCILLTSCLTRETCESVPWRQTVIPISRTWCVISQAPISYSLNIVFVYACRLQEISGISPLVRDLCLTTCFCNTDDSVALGQPHSIQAKNTTKDGAEFLLIFDSGEFSEDSTFMLTDWLAHVPKGQRYHLMYSWLHYINASHLFCQML